MNPTPNTLKHRFGNRALLAVSLRRQENLSFAQAFKLADQVIDVAQSCNDRELQSFIDDCRGS